ncbi:MAG: hypothetical protein R3E53_22990 [Myxococcota bacterium]
MELRREIFLAIGAIVVLNVLLAFGTIGLFVRMGPVIDRILDENVYSIGAAEEIVAVLAESGEGATRPRPAERAMRALERARSNVTEERENAPLARVEADLPAALAGDHDARRRVSESLTQLIAINRGAMREIDGEARRLGSAGAWSAVFIGFLSFLLGSFLVVRLRRRLVAPMTELHRVLEDVRRGGVYRRTGIRDAPAELGGVLSAIDDLLDSRGTGADAERRARAALVDAALVAVLDERSIPTVVVDPRGGIARANDAALELLADAESGEMATSLPIGEDGPKESASPFRCVPLPGGGWLCHVPPRDDEANGTGGAPEA